MNPKWLMATPAVVFLSACDGDPSAQLAAAPPATGAALAHYSENITHAVKLGANADLVQRFCKNMTGAACPPDIPASLSAAGFSGEGSGVVLASAFAKIEADKIDGKADQQSTAETYLRAAYKVVLAREPDEGGAQVNLKFLKDTGERDQLLRSMLQSAEFKTLP